MFQNQYCKGGAFKGVKLCCDRWRSNWRLLLVIQHHWMIVCYDRLPTDMHSWDSKLRWLWMKCSVQPRQRFAKYLFYAALCFRSPLFMLFGIMIASWVMTISLQPLLLCNRWRVTQSSRAVDKIIRVLIWSSRPCNALSGHKMVLIFLQWRYMKCQDYYCLLLMC